MRKEQDDRLGGFVSLNTGEIQDCYSCVQMKRKGLRSGFCSENRGSILRSYAQGRITGKRDKAGFCLKQNGTMEGSFWVRPYGKKRQEARFSDWTLSQDKKGIPELLTQAGWDTQEVWSLQQNELPLLYDTRAIPPEGLEQVMIHDRKELLQAARDIRENGGLGKCYTLAADINLRNQSWEPLGGDPDEPFRGWFDGAGHQVRNFRIKADHYPYAGFFGCTGEEAQIHNLTVDCVILGRGGYAAPLCALNQGKISNCISRGHTQAARRGGGLVARNEGSISKSCALGGIASPVLPFAWFWLAVMLSFLFAIGTMGILIQGQQTVAAEVFAPVIVDPNATPISPEESTVPEPDDTTDSSVAFVMNAEMLVGTENYAGNLGLSCPSWSTRGFVATMTYGDTVLYQSGLIQPGYGVDIVTLSGNLAPGEYECSVLLEFYDMDTNEKAAVNTVIPLELTVQ